MKIRFRTAYNDRFGVSHKVGDVAEMRDGIAVKLINRRIAEAVREAPVERAVVAPPETTAKRVAKPKTKARRSSRPAKEG